MTQKTFDAPEISKLQMIARREFLRFAAASPLVATPPSLRSSPPLQARLEPVSADIRLVLSAPHRRRRRPLLAWGPSSREPSRPSHQEGRRGQDTNRSLPTFEPVSVREREFRREKVLRRQRPARQFLRHGRFRATETVLSSVVGAAKPRKVKDYSDGARKPELRGTGWWAHKDSNLGPAD
jgi:hypothetical protein